ncbi:MAG: RNA polymerase sigma factor [Candidatus Competibacteraceae bacterium]
MPEQEGFYEFVSVTTQEIHREMTGLLPRLRRFAYGLSGSLDEADDLVQSTFERALSHLDQWQAGTRLDSWMYRILHSIRINRLHAENFRTRKFDDSDPDEQIGGDSAREIEAKLTLEAVRQFIWKLPEDQRTILLLIVVEGVSYKDASDMLGIPIGTVTSRLARARMAIKDFVEMTPP